MVLNRKKYKYGIDIPYDCQIGKGLYIGHFGGIVVSPSAVIGSNLNISQGTTIGVSSRGARMGAPVIGDSVYIAAGAKVFGKIFIGSNVAIGANAVVNKDIPDFSVVVGIPCHIISDKGSEGYCLNEV
jgi:Serine acetyltransferase